MMNSFEVMAAIALSASAPSIANAAPCTAEQIANGQGARSLLQELFDVGLGLIDIKTMNADGNFQGREELAKVAATARDVAAETCDPATAREIRMISGSASFHAAQTFHPKTKAEEDDEIALLDHTVQMLEPALAGTSDEINSYEWRGAAGQLFDYGQSRKDPRWLRWSASSVAANRYRVAQFPDDAFERELLAEALRAHGELTKDAAMMAEAEAIKAALPKEEDYPEVPLDRSRIFKVDPTP